MQWIDASRVQIEQDCVEQLNRITDTTEAMLVISSSWRYLVHNGHMTLHGFEYMLLLPNTERDTAFSFLKCFQRKLSDLTFASAGDSLTVSIGLCTAGPDSALTDRELQERATQAKLTAKVGGKNCIAWIDGDLLSGVNPRVV